MNVALYVRVSTDIQAEEGYSIDEQISRLNKYAEAHDWTVVKTYTDAGFSGGNINRPALQEMIKEIKNIDCVLVYKLDRLSRSQKDTLYLIEDVFAKNNTAFVSMSENFDTGTPFGKAMIGILAVFAQLEKENIKMRMSMGKEGRAKEGLWKGGGASPIGYDYVDGHLVVNEFESLIVKEAHRLYRQGKSIKQIEKEFEQKGYASKYGKITARRLNDILTNDLYIGKIKNKGHVYQGEHEPLIDEQIFNDNQKIHMMKYRSRTSGTGSLLGGILWCRQCGARYALNLSGKGYKYYCCHSRRKTTRAMIRDPNCKNKIYKAEELESIILGEIAKVGSKSKKEREKEYKDNTKPLRREIEKIDRQRMRLLDLYSTGMYSLDELQSKLTPLDDRKKALEQQINKPVLSKDDANRAFTSFKDVVDRGNRDDLKYSIHILINKIEIDGDDLYITWNF